MVLPIPPDDDVQLLLDTVWAETVEHWPQYAIVDRLLYSDHNLDIDELVRRTPGELLIGGRGGGGAAPSPQDQLKLTVAGVAACHDMDAEIDAFLAAVRLAVEAEAEDPRSADQPSITANQVIRGASDGQTRADSPETAMLARRVGLLVVNEPWTSWSSLYEGGWEIRPDRRVRRYRDVVNIADYWDRRVTAMQPITVKQALTEEARPPTYPGPTDATDAPIFVVHGRDEARKYDVVRVLERTTGSPVIVLHEQPNRGATLLEKLERHGAAAGYAVVLLTADDEGRIRGGTDRLEPRGRQNVILELGLFLGGLGRSRVAVLVDPTVERPSDLDGLVYIALDEARAWRVELLRELEAVGINVDWQRLP